MTQQSLLNPPNIIFFRKNRKNENVSSKCVVICRGLPGSGKSTFSGAMDDPWTLVDVCSADQYFTDQDGFYRFDPSKLKEAHAYCMKRFLKALDKDFAPADSMMVFVDNTNTEEWQMMPYIAEVIRRIEQGEKISLAIADFVCTVEESFNRNTHNVPMHTIERMQQNLLASRNLKATYFNVVDGKIVYH